MNNKKSTKKYPRIIGLVHIFRVFQHHLSVLFYSNVFKIKLKTHKCKYGKNLSVNGKVYFTCQFPSRLQIDNNFKINSRFGSNLVGLTNLAIFQIISDGKIVIGKNCGFSSPVISSRNSIIIGNYVKIGGNVRIFDHDYHSLNNMNRRDPYLDAADVNTASVIIEDDVFIGTNSIILKGVKIGKNSVIGAGSVVSKNIPSNVIAAGNPCKVIKKLISV